jgi:hypothetical protein
MMGIKKHESVRRREWREYRRCIFDEPFDGQRLSGHVTELGIWVARAHQRSCSHRFVSEQENP